MNILDFYKNMSTLSFDLNKTRSVDVKDELVLKVNSVLDWCASHPDIVNEQALKSMDVVLKNMVYSIGEQTDINEIQKTIKSIKSFVEHSFSGLAKASNVVPEPISEYSKLLFMSSADTDEDLGFWKACAENPISHPSWIYFMNEISQIIPEITEEQIKDVFIQLMKGICFEIENKNGMETLRQLSADDKSDLQNTQQLGYQLYATTKQIIGHRTVNPYYQNAILMLEGLDKNKTMFNGWGIDADPQNREFSLWSGGKEVMTYSSQKCRVLEGSRLGNLFDNFKMHPNWKVEYPIWNLLSAKFVENNILEQIHRGADPVVINYHFRSDDPNSIGRMIELPSALAALSLSEHSETPKELSVKLIPLMNDPKVKGGIKPLVHEISIKISAEDYINSLNTAMGSLRCGLLCLNELWTNIKGLEDEASTNTRKVLEPYVKANLFMLKQQFPGEYDDIH